ncbi:MAG: hypothetical protein ACJ76H_07655 [Bacteriovoracaceae bacterium]
MKSLQKAMVSCALILTMINPARSAVGVSFAAPVVVVLGVAALGVSGGAGYAGYRLIKKKTTGMVVAGVGALLASAGAAYFGLLLLDGNQQGQFGEISSESAAALGVSAQDIAVYNSEVEQVNAIAREIGEQLNGQENVELSRDLWVELGSELSPATMKTVIAIAQQEA